MLAGVLTLLLATAGSARLQQFDGAPNLPPGAPNIPPTFPPTWSTRNSSYLYTCNWTDMVYVPAVQNWSIISLDWSDAKWGPAGWAAAQPMTTEEVLYADAKRIVSASKGKAFVYRNTCKALPWFTSVRRLLEDASYRPWFLSYAAVPPIQGVGYYSPPCDAYTGKCSMLYHDSTQSPDYTRMPFCPITGDCSVQVPGYPSGDGNCSAPGCDVGSVPVGEYVFDPRAWNVSIKGQTLGEWWMSDYLFSATAAGDADIVGFYFDDSIGDGGLCSEMDSHQAADLGLTPADAAALTAAYRSNFASVYAQLTARGAYTEQQFTTVSPPSSPAQCAALFRGALCAPAGGPPPSLLVRVDDANPRLSMATYFLGRGAYGWYGHTWQGCGSPNVNEPVRFPAWHSELYDLEVGEPAGACAETAPGSAVFARQWSRASVSVNCSDLSVDISPRP